MFTVLVNPENTGEYLKGKCAMSDFSKQTAEFLSCVLRNIPAGLTSEQMQHWVENPKDLQVILDGLALVVCGTTDELQDSTLIHIDRAVIPPLPEWAKEWYREDLQQTGPAEYDPSKIELYLHPKQRDGSIEGHDLLIHLETEGILKDCLNLQDALELQKLGSKRFREIFGNNFVYCWKSVTRRRAGNLNVPCVYYDNGTVVLSWYWLNPVWRSSSPAARLSN